MKVVLTAVVAMAMAGCANMSHRQKAVAAAVGTAIVIGAVAAHQSKDGRVKIPSTPSIESAR
jgi:hypothetical protein